ncbi:DsbA family protein [Chitinophaga pendula]|uniref:DsbA family protein n=1 Tax=Chitinophaga TaxID=79328 RepID=UPI0012FE797A|nr:MULTISPECIES: DsbA family protein [Chitinophaga]UCJ07727.1 DsbA family protein [Chitinophaga pendula]
MNKPKLIYVMDAYCSWCYGFSPVIRKLSEKYAGVLDTEVLSGGMIPEDMPVTELLKRFDDPIAAYTRVQETTGVPFGEKYLDFIRQAANSSRIMNSELPAKAMIALKTLAPGQQAQQAGDVQMAVFQDAKDLTDINTYLPIAASYGIDQAAFEQIFNDEQLFDEARYEFQLAKQLQVTGYPAVLMQVAEDKCYLIARGYTDYDSLRQRVDSVLAETRPQITDISTAGESCSVNNPDAC